MRKVTAAQSGHRTGRSTDADYVIEARASPEIEIPDFLAARRWEGVVFNLSSHSVLPR